MHSIDVPLLTEGRFPPEVPQLSSVQREHLKDLDANPQLHSTYDCLYPNGVTYSPTRPRPSPDPKELFVYHAGSHLAALDRAAFVAAILEAT